MYCWRFAEVGWFNFPRESISTLPGRQTLSPGWQGAPFLSLRGAVVTLCQPLLPGKHEPSKCFLFYLSSLGFGTISTASQSLIFLSGGGRTPRCTLAAGGPVLCFAPGFEAWAQVWDLLLLPLGGWGLCKPGLHYPSGGYHTVTCWLVMHGLLAGRRRLVYILISPRVDSTAVFGNSGSGS